MYCMDKKLLIDLKTKGDEGSFDFEPHLPTYNPLLEFIKEVSCKEKAHTSILADLLNPHGMHNTGSSFLKLFLSSLKISHIRPEDIDMDSVTVTRERVINVGEERKKLDRAGRKFRRIDILIKGKPHNGETFAIAIENKLNGAQFQEYQLDAYRNLLKRLVGKSENVKTVCLMKYRDGEDGEADIYLDSKGLSSIIDQCCFANPALTPMLRPYTQYLMDLDMDDNILQNSRLLGFEKHSYGGGAIWFEYKGLNPRLPFELLYSDNDKHPGKPDFDKISDVAIDYLRHIAGIEPFR